MNLIISEGNFWDINVYQTISLHPSVFFKEYIPQKINNVKEILYQTVSEDVCDFIESHINIISPLTKVLGPLNNSDVRKLRDVSISNLININKINDLRYINKFCEAINNKLFYNGIFIGCAETLDQRKVRILKKFPKVIACPYYFADFILKRVFPKFQLTLKLYFLITKGRNRVLAKSEILGRLISCGFEIIDCKEIDRLLWFAVKKIREPYYDCQPSYGALFKMKRVGENGKIIYVYKIRTMHPYSEYLQQYIYKNCGSTTGDKFDNDFRIANWGAIFRKYWIDELPMLVNWIKGDLKLVGVRPLSLHKFGLYPKYLQEKRTKSKPGLFPPYYANLPTPKSFDEFYNVEESYLDAYEKSPFLTDFKYFFKILYNILFKKAHSV
jgi:lipopolysaccharide/colanic/teichoic acid biosynthesis glycosyltransferase